MNFCRLFLLSSFLLYTNLGLSQINRAVVDHTNWQFIKFSLKIDDLWSFDIAPIHRFNNNITTHQNSSVDFTLKRTLGNGFHASLITRTWFTPNRKPRQFLWFDIGYKKAISDLPLMLSQRIRYHWALDINDNVDRDFIRYVADLSYTTKNKKWKPAIAIEPWFGLNDIAFLERVRYEVALTYAANSNISFTAKYRPEVWYNQDVNPLFHMWVTGVTYKFLNPIRKTKEM